MATSTHSSHHSGAQRPTSIVRGIPAEEKAAHYTTTEHITAPVSYTTTAPAELPSYYPTTQPIEATSQVLEHNAHLVAAHVAATTGPAYAEAAVLPTTTQAAWTGPRTTSKPFGEPFTQETRKVSSVVVESTLLGTVPPQDNVRYVEVPTVEEQVKVVTRKEVREVEKVVRRPEVEFVERVVVVPRVEYVDKRVEVEVVQVRPIEVKVPQVVDVPKEVIIEKKVIIPREVYQTKKIPGPVIERPVPVVYDRTVEVPRPYDTEVPVVVAQTIKPVITESASQLVVDAVQYEPEVVPVDVHLAKPVNTSLEVVGKVSERHKLVTVTAAQYNMILRALNSKADERVQLPYIEEQGHVPFCAEHEAAFIVAPDHVRIEGWTRKMHPEEVVHTREAEMEAIRSIHSVPPAAGNRCCGPRAPRTATATASATAAPVTETVIVQRALSNPQTEQRTAVTEKTISYHEPVPELAPRSEIMPTTATPEGGSIRSQVQVVPSHHGTIPIQQQRTSRVCC